MRRSIVAAAAIISAFSACGTHTRGAAPATTPEAEVYSAAVRALTARDQPSPTSIVINDSTEHFNHGHPTGFSDAADVWRHFQLDRFASLPADLAADYSQRNAARRPLVGRLQVSGPQGAYPFMREVQLDTIFVAGSSTSYYGARPGDRLLITFSDVGFSVDGELALVYVGYHCGGLCGAGALWLMRRTASGWESVIAAPLWIS